MLCDCACEMVKVPGSRRYRCPSCELYNAAVEAVRAAALALAQSRAKNFNPSGRSWMNQYGSFHEGEQVATAEEVACFDELTTAARRVHYPLASSPRAPGREGGK